MVIPVESSSTLGQVRGNWQHFVKPRVKSSKPVHKKSLLERLEIADCAYKMSEGYGGAKRRTQAMKTFFNNHFYPFGSLGEKNESGFFAHKGKECWISYRGTESTDNIKTDAWAIRKSMPFAKGKAHAGFLYGFYASKVGLDHELSTYCDVLLTGKELDKQTLEEDINYVLEHKSFSDIVDITDMNKLMQILDQSGTQAASKLLRGLHFFGFKKPLEILGKKGLWILQKLGITSISKEQLLNLKDSKKTLNQKLIEMQDCFKSFKKDPSSLAKNDLSPVQKEVKKAIDHFAVLQQVSLNLTGISMGGALSSIAGLYFADRYGIADKMNVTTFASPRAFNRTAGHYYNALLKEETTRVTNYLYDIITFFPMVILGYLHVGKMLPIEQKPKNLGFKNPIAGHATGHYRKGLQTLPQDLDPHREISIAGSFLNLSMLQNYFIWVIEKLKGGK